MDVRQAVVDLGIDVVEERGGEIVAPCPGHERKTGSKDHRPSWSINADTGLHYCFSCHYGGNLYTLAVELVGLVEAKKFLSGGQTAPSLRERRTGFRVNRRWTWASEFPKPRQPFPESELALFIDAPAWAMEQRRVDRTSLDYYGVRWDDDASAWVLPLRDPRRGYLIGYQTKHQKERRMINVPPGMDKSSTLFGIVENADAKDVVLVESPLDVVLLHTLDVPAVAICGSRLSKRQSDLLHRFTGVVLALDNDDAGRRETDRIIRSDAGFDMRRAMYRSNGKDVGEMTDADILAAIGW